NKYHYDLSPVSNDSIAVKYTKTDEYLRVSDNRSYLAWFKIPKYNSFDNYNFIHNYDETTNKGYKIDLFDGNFIFKLNNIEYNFPVSISDDTWYCYLVNLDQRQRKIEHYLYKRNVDNEMEAVKIGRAH